MNGCTVNDGAAEMNAVQAERRAVATRETEMNRTLWILQVLLGLFFALASGAPKLILPEEALPMPIPIPHAFLIFIGVAEVLGGLGLILPGVTKVRPGLTPLAAGGLVLVTIGATAYQLAADAPGNAIFAAVLGLVVAFVGYGRWKLAPHQAATREPELELAA
jgi:hypothetical protein